MSFPHPPSEQELHAYVDGRLSGERRQALERYLAEHPALATELQGWQEDIRRLRAALADPTLLSSNPRLDPVYIRQHRRQRRQRQLGIAASLLLAVVLGLGGGWQLRDRALQASIPPMQDALEAHRLFALQQTPAVDVRSVDIAVMERWLRDNFGHVAHLDAMVERGLTPVGSRLLVNEQGAAALLLFEDASGERISLYLRAPGQLYGTMLVGNRAQGELQTHFWSRGGYNYALVSHAGDPRADQLQQALRL
ncbi:anti-sigma factor family protein [Pseudomonas mangrovi]|uniref:Anti-sigma factor n=1 Tax=Pseudomonas mangrovi TaxID=2161748 RepID=A0A2T5PEP3_9PSED|nr:anti-sigma factor [Pseudomonas mangrovi]PTU76200.1 anti-sigma factor [Pseudomonas mangrovi]